MLKRAEKETNRCSQTRTKHRAYLNVAWIFVAARASASLPSRPSDAAGSSSAMVAAARPPAPEQ